MTYTTWKNTSTAYRAYTTATERCRIANAAARTTPAGQVRPVFQTRTVRRTGRVRRYITNINEIIGLDTTNGVTTLRGRHIDNAERDRLDIALAEVTFYLDDTDSLRARGLRHGYDAWRPETISQFDVIDAVKAAIA